jgi:hypothetical protein
MEGTSRLVFLCQTGCEPRIQSRLNKIRCFKLAYYHANFKINGFVSEGLQQNIIQQDSVDLLKSFETLLDYIQPPEFRIDLLPSDCVRDFNDRLSLFNIQTLVRVSGTSKRIAPCYQRCLVSCKCLLIELVNRNNDIGVDSIRAVINMTANYITRTLKKTTCHNDFEKFQQDELAPAEHAANERIRSALAIVDMASTKEFMAYQTLMAPGFVYDRQHLGSNMTNCAFKQQADWIIRIIRMELDEGVYTLEAFMIFSHLIEQGVAQVARCTNNEHAIEEFNFRRFRLEICSGKMCWEGVIRMMDSAAADLQRVYGESESLWVKSRENLIKRKPNATSAFIDGLQSLFDIQQTAYIHGINFNFRVSQSTFLSCGTISNAFNARLSRGTTKVSNVKSILTRVASVFPEAAERILQRSKGSRFVFHGVFVAYVLFCQKQLDETNCPETLYMECDRLIALQKCARTLCDAAVILNESKPEEREAIGKYMEGFSGERLLPMFMPISQISADRSEYTLKHRSCDVIENGLAILFAYRALQLIQTRLPDGLRVLQGLADKITMELRSIIRVNRIIHFKLYGRLINELCVHLD